MKEPVDRRVRKTRKMLRQCLTTLLKEKKIQEITVREIADLADINRGTFYLHYKDVYDLMEQIENELIEELETVLNKYDVPSLLSKPSLIFSELYPLVRENVDIISTLMGENGDLNFVNRLKKLLRDRCIHEWVQSSFSKNCDSFEVYTYFIISGCVGIVQYWLETGMRETPEEMAQLTENFILKGIHVLEP